VVVVVELILILIVRVLRCAVVCCALLCDLLDLQFAPRSQLLATGKQDLIRHLIFGRQTSVFDKTKACTMLNMRARPGISVLIDEKVVLLWSN